MATCSEPLVWTCKACGHSFHEKEWVKAGRKCPACERTAGNWKCSLCQETFGQPALGLTHPCHREDPRFANRLQSHLGPTPPKNRFSGMVRRRYFKLIFFLTMFLPLGFLALKYIPWETKPKSSRAEVLLSSNQSKASPTFSSNNQILNNERAFSNQIKQACGWGADGFITRINEVDADFLGQILAESDPEKVLWDRETVFWMEVVKRYGAIYEKTQREQNHLKGISTAQWREPLLDIFSRRLELRGGGSVSQEMWLYLPGHIEWILGHMETGEARPPPHQQLFQETMQGHPFHLGIDPSAENRVAKVLSDLKGLETQMPARQAAFVRAEFDRFFKKEIPVSSSYQSSDPSVNDPETTNPGTPPHESKNTAVPPTKEVPQGNRRLSKLLKLPEYTGTPHTDQLDRPTTP